MIQEVKFPLTLPITTDSTTGVCTHTSNTNTSTETTTGTVADTNSSTSVIIDGLSVCVCERHIWETLGQSSRKQTSRFTHSYTLSVQRASCYPLPCVGNHLHALSHRG